MTKYSPLTGESEQLFADQMSSLVSNKLSGYQARLFFGQRKFLAAINNLFFVLKKCRIASSAT